MRRELKTQDLYWGRYVMAVPVPRVAGQRVLLQVIKPPAHLHTVKKTVWLKRPETEDSFFPLTEGMDGALRDAGGRMYRVYEFDTAEML